MVPSLRSVLASSMLASRSDKGIFPIAIFWNGFLLWLEEMTGVSLTQGRGRKVSPFCFLFSPAAEKKGGAAGGVSEAPNFCAGKMRGTW